MNQIIINGQSFNFSSGSSIIVNNGQVMADGKVIHTSQNTNLIVEIHGDVNNLKSDGSVNVKGSVLGSVDARNSVHCGDVGGDVNAGNSVHARSIEGKVKAGNSVYSK
jgi:hypothetical protein